MASAVGLCVLLLGAWPDRENHTSDSSLPSSSTVIATDTSAGDAVKTTPRSQAVAAEFTPLPSHENTKVDGGIKLDANGDVVPERGLRRMFDYFLTGIGRDDLEGLRARLAAFLQQQDLPEKVQQQALAKFDLYIEYRRQLGSIQPPSGDARDLLRAFEARRDLRLAVLGRDMADGFFGREEAEDRYVIGMKVLDEAEGLSVAEKQQRQALLEEQLPEDIRRAREQSVVAITLNERTQQLRNSGASESELWAMRQQLVGPEAAARLKQLDQGRAEWQQRMEDYQRARDEILTSSSLAPDDQGRAIEELIEDRFSGAEQKRVRALERIETARAP